jgi:ABC-2 type transport system permease protein
MWKYLSLTWDMTKLSILSAMEYRTSFLLQVFGMVVNDIGLLAAWAIFFRAFPSIHGWGFKEMALLYGISTANYALVAIFCGGGREIARAITQGELDYYLTLPKNVLWQVLVGRTDITALGDLIFGIGVYIISGYTQPQQVLMYALITVVTAVALGAFILLAESMTFYLGNFEDTADDLINALMGLCMYPQNVYSGLLKLLTFSVLPAFFIATVPIRIIEQFSWSDLALVSLFTLALAWLAAWTFTNGLKRYESGNLISVRK